MLFIYLKINIKDKTHFARTKISVSNFRWMKNKEFILQGPKKNSLIF